MAAARPFTVLTVLLFSLGLELELKGLTLTWREPTSGAPVAGYAVYFQEAGESHFRRIDVGSVTRHRLDGLLGGRTYAFYVTAYNQARVESDPSNTFIYMAPESSGVRLGIRPYGRYGVLLTWNTEPDKSYVVEWKRSLSDPQWTDLSGVLTAIGPATTWATGIATLANGYFTVRCLD